MAVVYADSSALTKLVLDEAESDILRDYLASVAQLFSSALVLTELLRATRRLRQDREVRALRILDDVTLIALDEPLLRMAARIEPTRLRSLDAIHIASALTLGSEL